MCGKVRDMLPWLAVLAILLFNPIGLMCILPAAALLSFSGTAYPVTVVVLVRRVPAMWSSGQDRQETRQTEEPAAASSQQPAAVVSCSSGM